ncbi:MAG: hypothetical protein FWE40_03525 [Oscillospiraceae bacterium]|nr:hypothetical protein [Oscillospiraceae bacterium]
MLVKTYRGTASERCVVALENQRFILQQPAELVLAFLHDDYSALCDCNGNPPTAEQAEYYREQFARHSAAPLLRDMINHVLVCEQERGFDPVARLAAYAFAHDMFDLSRVASFSQRVTLETSVDSQNRDMLERWHQLLQEGKGEAITTRGELFDALLADAQAAGSPFSLTLAAEFSSPSQLLKSFVVEMVHTRVLLHRCACGLYALAGEALPCSCD